MFHSARLKLTAWYLIIVMLISITFSVVIYKMLTIEVDRFERAQRFRIERRIEEYGIFPPEIRYRITPTLPVNSELIEETKHRTFVLLIIINAVILVLSGGLGYLLAGRTLKPIKEMVDEQNRFISDASHELRTPLTSLKSAFEVYLRNSKPTLEEAKTLAAESVTEVNKLQSLSDSLLQLAQYERPNGNIQFEKLAMAEVINEAVKKVSPLAKQKEITLQKEVQEVDMEGNKYGLIDLLVILLDNAIKYSHQKTQVNITSKQTDGWVLVEVEDHGIGIEEKDIPHIFDRFYRADAARSKSERDGYGLGLSIARKIVDVHKGEIEVKSKKDEGSKFSIRLPIKRSSALKKPPFFR